MNWDKVDKCNHEWSDSYHDGGPCGTPYCSWSERRCKKCLIYEVICGCGSFNGLSGAPEKWYRKMQHKKDQRLLVKLKEQNNV